MTKNTSFPVSETSETGCTAPRVGPQSKRAPLREPYSTGGADSKGTITSPAVDTAPLQPKTVFEGHNAPGPQMQVSWRPDKNNIVPSSPPA